MARVEKAITQQSLTDLNAVARLGTVVMVDDKRREKTTYVTSVVGADVLQSLAKAREGKPFGMTPERARWAQRLFAGTGATVSQSKGKYYLVAPLVGEISIVDEIPLDTVKESSKPQQVIFPPPESTRDIHMPPIHVHLPEDRAAAKRLESAKKEQYAIELAKKISFGRMARALFTDLTDMRLGYVEHVSELHVLIPHPFEGNGNGESNGRKPRLPGPLAVEIAQAELGTLGLLDYIALVPDTKEELFSKLKTDLKPGGKEELTQQEIEGRLKVTGYHWVRLPEREMVSALQARLERKIQQGEWAKNDMAELYYGLIRTVMRQMLGTFHNREEGSVGLQKALYSFDWRFGFDPGPYIYEAIKNELKREVRDKGHIVKAPRPEFSMHTKFMNVIEALMQERVSVTPEEVAKRLEIPLADAVDMFLFEQSRFTLSLDAPVTGTDESQSDKTVLDLVMASPDHAGDTINRLLVPDILSQLTPREKRVIELRFWGNMSQMEIAGVLGLSQMTISRILSQTLSKLRDKYVSDD